MRIFCRRAKIMWKLFPHSVIKINFSKCMWLYGYPCPSNCDFISTVAMHGQWIYYRSNNTFDLWGSFLNSSRTASFRVGFDVFLILLRIASIISKLLFYYLLKDMSWPVYHDLGKAQGCIIYHENKIFI